MISKGRISHHEEGELIASTTYVKRKKGNEKKSVFKPNKENVEMSKARCFNCQKHGHFARDCKQRRRAHRFKDKFDYRKDSSENKEKDILRK